MAEKVVGELGPSRKQPPPRRRKVPADKEDRGAVRVSRFEITVSTNVLGATTPEGDWDQTTDQLLDDLGEMFREAFAGRDAFWKKVIVFKNKRGGQHTFDRNIIGIRTGEHGAKTEVGDNIRGSRVHAHQNVWIKHNSRIHLDPKKLKELFMKTPTYVANRTGMVHGLYVHVKGNTSDEDEYEGKLTVEDLEPAQNPHRGYEKWKTEAINPMF